MFINTLETQVKNIKVLIDKPSSLILGKTVFDFPPILLQNKLIINSIYLNFINQKLKVSFTERIFRIAYNRSMCVKT